jgi:raffinose/stachyose/melibiose transport system substrate-binding protein
MMANNYVYAQTPDWNQQRAAGKTTFAATPGWKTTVQHFQDLAKAGCFQKGAAAAGFPQQGQLLGSGKASAAPAPMSAVKTIHDSGVKFPLSAFAVPADSADATRLTASPNYGFAASAQSKHLDAAKQFLDFLASDEGGRIWAKARGDVSYADAMAHKVPAAYKPLGSYLEDGKYLPMPSLGWSPGAFEALGKNLTGLLTGQVSPDQVLQAVDQAWDAAG